MPEYAVAPEQVLRGQAATLSITFADDDGATVDPGVVTVTIARADGTAVATDVATGGTGAAARTYPLTATDTADLDLLAVTWASDDGSVATATVEIVGAWLYTIAQARAFDKKQLASAATYPSADLAAARARLLDQFEEICGTAFVPRYKRIVLDADRSASLLLPDLRVSKLREVSLRVVGATDFTPLTADEFADVEVSPTGLIRREALGFFDGLFTRAQLGEYQLLNTRRQNVRVAYEYGWPAPPDAIRRAALTVLLAQTVPTNIDQRVTSVTDSIGSTAYATAGRQINQYSAMPYFGIPYVDSVLAQYREHVRQTG